MHTGSTDNYELTQFASSDKPAWLVDYNEDMRKIDAQMKVNADGIAELGESIGQEGEDITDLKERMAAAEQDIDTVQETIGTGELETEVKNLIGASNELLGLIHENAADITQIQQSIAGIGDNINALSQLAYTIANVYDSTQTYEVGSYAIYLNTLYKCITAITVGEAFNPAKWTSVKVMNEVGAGGGGGTSYTAGPGIDITNNEISFNDNTAAYDNTDSGLSATTIKGAIDELAVGGSSTPDVTITGNGVKTLVTILNELATAVDFSKITRHTQIVMQRGDQFIVASDLVVHTTEYTINFGYTVVSSTSMSILNCSASKNNSLCHANAVLLTNAQNPSVTNQVSEVVSNGDKFYVYY